MTGHGIVPPEATVEMKLAGARSIGATINVANHAERASQCWQAMRAAAPRHEIGDEDVERLARIGCESDNSECVGPDCLCWDSQVRETSAALEAFRDELGGTEGRK